MPGYVRAPQRQAQLLEAAKRVLIRDGYGAITLRSVAAEAGVRLSTLQYIFRTRTELVRALTQKVLDDCAFKRHETQLRGLDIELRDAAHWYGSRVLVDPGMRELLRAELVATLSRQPAAPEDYPAGRPILGGLLRRWLHRMADEGDEVFTVPADLLGAVATHEFFGLTYQFLRDGDLDRYYTDVDVFIDALVALADPKPKTSD